jgi:acyl-lipid omega-6 desaturase (Delta-12 desaturase)
VTNTHRTGSDLVRATRSFSQESRARSWWAVGSTLTLLVALMVSTAFVPWWPLQIVGSVVSGLVFVRMFVIYHDYIHGAILKRSRLARAVMYTYGTLAMTPPRIWKYSHNFHHAHNMQIETSGVGSFPLYTVEMWNNAGFWRRFGYRITRHPIAVAFGYATVFVYELCIDSFIASPRKNWEAGLAIVIHAALIAAIWTFFGANVLLFSFIFPFAVAAALGAYLFYAQHNFEGIYIQSTEEWNHSRAALESSSFMKFGPVMNWFTANIGFHHIHHLNPMIPFYRLPETMESMPELQNPIVTRLRPREVLSCFRLKLWDPDRGRMVAFRDAAAAGV